MTFESAFAEAERRYSNQVAASTWGHLAPKKNKTYVGNLVIAYSLYNGPQILQENIPIEASPWWFEAVHDFMHSLPEQDEGTVIRVHITFRNYRFWSKRTEVLVKA